MPVFGVSLLEWRSIHKWSSLVLAVAVIIGATLLGRKIVEVAKPKETVLLIAPDDLPVLPPSKTVSGGGGGGGDRDKFIARAAAIAALR